MKNLVMVFIMLLFSCAHSSTQSVVIPKIEKNINIRIGAAQLEKYLPLLDGKNVALVVNQTSMLENVHLVDTLLNRGIKIRKIFAPEHGFRGEVGAGDYVADAKDLKTGLPILSLYGKNKKPSAEQLQDIDIVVFDIQDVGARFYTYISTMHYVMEACAEGNKKCIILDRPNPNGYYIDGNVLEIKHQSFVGMHPIPVVHGLTVGELALMINGEKWLANGVQCDLEVVKCLEYDHKMRYSITVRPSPNLPNDLAIQLYPSLCFFEGTEVSVGRGTDFPFQVVGHPAFKDSSFFFTPQPNTAAPSPLQQGKKCMGIDLRKTDVRTSHFSLAPLLLCYEKTGKPTTFFNAFFVKLAGTEKLQKQIIEGMSEQAIKASWQEDLKAYKKMRKKYIIYPDFEE